MVKISKKIHQYTAIFERNEHDGYTVTVPSLPGLVTEGGNLAEAKAMAEEAITCYLEGLQKEGALIPNEIEISSFRLSVAV